MILVADSSALIALSTCDGLALLDQLFGDVLVPKAVYEEVIRGDRPEAKALEQYLQGKVRSVNVGNYVYLDALADPGETEAMLLYKQLAAEILLIDDKRGRRIAKLNEINTVGSLGVLLSAKRAGLISEIRSRVEQISKSPVYLHQSLIETVLAMAGES